MLIWVHIVCDFIATIHGKCISYKDINKQKTSKHCFSHGFHVLCCTQETMWAITTWPSLMFEVYAYVTFKVTMFKLKLTLRSLKVSYNKYHIDMTVNSLRPRQMAAIFKYIFLNENVLIAIKISLKFVPKGWINSIPALVQIMAWRRPGDKPLSEPMMVSLLTHICITRPQWVNSPCLKSTCSK